MVRFTLQASYAVRKGKFRILAMALFLLAMQNISFAQQQTGGITTPKANTYEDYGNTLNVGIGAGYYSYLPQSVPFLFVDYEFNVAHNFTLAPFIGFASYQSSSNYYYGSEYYYYHETVIPIGVKGTYYFDRLLRLNRRWDIYAAASLGFVIDKVTWQDGYGGSTSSSITPSTLYLDLHIGAEYHVSHNIGVYLDLSTGVSTVGIAFHNL